MYIIVPMCIVYTQLTRSATEKLYRYYALKVLHTCKVYHPLIS